MARARWIRRALARLRRALPHAAAKLKGRALRPYREIKGNKTAGSLRDVALYGASLGLSGLHRLLGGGRVRKPRSLPTPPSSPSPPRSPTPQRPAAATEEEEIDRRQREEAENLTRRVNAAGRRQLPARPFPIAPPGSAGSGATPVPPRTPEMEAARRADHEFRNELRRRSLEAAKPPAPRLLPAGAEATGPTTPATAGPKQAAPRSLPMPGAERRTAPPQAGRKAPAPRSLPKAPGAAPPGRRFVPWTGWKSQTRDRAGRWTGMQWEGEGGEGGAAAGGGEQVGLLREVRDLLRELRDLERERQADKAEDEFGAAAPVAAAAPSAQPARRTPGEDVKGLHDLFGGFEDHDG